MAILSACPQELARWGLLDPGTTTSAIFAKLGIEVAKIGIAAQDPVQGLAHFLAGRAGNAWPEGLPRWIKPSVAETMSRRTRLQTLFIPPHGAGFVDVAAGRLRS